jgi:hypothetical protein
MLSVGQRVVIPAKPEPVAFSIPIAARVVKR